MKITKKLALITVSIAVLSGLLLGFVVFNRVSDVIKEQIILAQISSAKNTMHNINRLLIQAKRDVQMMAEDEFLKKYVLLGSKENNLYIPLKEELKERMEMTGPWDSIMIFTQEGNEILSIKEEGMNGTLNSDPEILQAFNSSIGGATYISDWHISKNRSLPSLIYAVAINGEDDKPIGTLIAHYRWSAVEKILYELPSDVHAHLFNKSGDVIASSDNQSSKLLHIHTIRRDFINKILEDKSSISEVSSSIHGDYDSLKVLVYQDDYEGLQNMGWRLLLELPAKTIFEEATSIATQSGLSVFMILLLLAVLLTFFANRVLKPLCELTKISTRIGNGDFTQRLEIESDDEIGTLAASFNSMSDKINKRTVELENACNELKLKDEIMIAQSKQSAMGEMIGMIAHQWRQPISIIAMGANNVLADIELDTLEEETLKDTVSNIVEQTQELSKIIDDFRNFFKPDKNAEDILIADVVKKVLGTIKPSLDNNTIALTLQLGEECKIKTYSRELMQVLINILNNAKEALVENREVDRKISISIEEKNNYIFINICDNGGGIDEKIVNQICTPYFSTKNEKNGTGLGLYISKIIVEKHLKGTLKFYNKDDGLCSEMTLPYTIENKSELE